MVRKDKDEDKPEHDEVPERRIRVADRCDRCGAQAFASAVVNAVELFFCGHHFRKAEAGLYAVASRIVDERHWIDK